MANSHSSQKVWFITGTSSGFGRYFVKTVLARGDKVIATARNLSSIEDLKTIGVPVLRLDVTDDFRVIQEVAREAIAIYGRVDVLLNNAGVSIFGTVEEVGTAGFMKQFQVNFFSVLSVTNAFLPHFRERREGTIVLMGSRSGGWRVIQGFGPYSASKAAVHAIGEAIQLETAALGIRTLIVEPGGCNTQTLMNSTLTEPEAFIPDYDEFHKVNMKAFMDGHGNQPGDADKAVERIVDVVRGEGMAAGKPFPRWLFLGSDCEKNVRDKIDVTLQTLDTWKDVISSIDRDTTTNPK